MSGFYEVIEASLYDSVREVLDNLGYQKVPVVYANQNVLEPSKTYCVINILDFVQNGYRDEGTFISQDPSQEDPNVLDTISHYSIPTQFSFIGESAGNVSHDFRHNTINNRKAYESFMKRNFGLLQRSSLRKAPQLRETEWVAGFNMDISFSFAIHTRQSYDWVEFININGEVFRIWNEE